MRRQFAWNFAGNGLYNFSQWLLLVILARAAGPEEVGRFTLLLAITAPVFVTVGLNLRVVVATDAAGRWRMNDYFALQPIANAGSAALSIAVGALLGLHGETLLALSVLTLAKATESRSQVYYGYFQRHRRFDLLAVSLFARALLGPVGFLTGILAGGGLVAACAGLAVGWLLCQLLLDSPNSRRIAAAGGTPIRDPAGTSPARLWALARVASPLGIDKGISSLAVNVPRYSVQSTLGAASLGVYGGLAYLAQAISMLTSSVSTLLVSPLAEYHHRGQVRAFRRVLTKLLLFCLVILLVAPLGAWLVGEPFLAATLGREYADRGLLVVLMVAAGVTNIQRSLCKALEAAHRFKTYVLVDAVTTATIAACAVPFVRWWGLEGAAWALTAGFATGSVLVAFVIAQILREMRSRQP